MEDFKFKVGDKIRLGEWADSLYILIDFIGINYLIGTGEDGCEYSYYKRANWLPYEEPKQKTKLQKFYYATNDGNYNYAFFKPENKKHFYLTEEEFLEKFEIIK